MMTKKNDPPDTLQKLFSKPKSWMKDGYAAYYEGNKKIDEYSPHKLPNQKATSFCLVGAVLQIYGTEQKTKGWQGTAQRISASPKCKTVIEKLIKTVNTSFKPTRRVLSTSDLEDWNDSTSRRLADIRKLVKLAKV